MGGLPVSNEERKEKLIPFDFDEDDCDVIILTKDKEVHLPSSFLKMASTEDINDNVIEMKSMESGKVLLALSFYHPRNWSNSIELSDLEDLFFVTDALKLKKEFRQHLISHAKLCIDKAAFFDEQLLKVLHIAQTYEIGTLVEAIRTENLGLLEFGQLESACFTVLERKYRCEILSNTIIRYVKNAETPTDKQLTELRAIFHLFTLTAHRLHYTDLAVKKDFLSYSLWEHCLENTFTCDKDSKYCVTLVVEGKEIFVNSCLLTSNSPVFKTMLNSTRFKEGQSRRIELPGKKLDEVAYFLQFLTTIQDINDETNIWALGALCHEYQVDWLVEKIKSFINKNYTVANTKTLLRYLALTEDMQFGMHLQKILIRKLTGHFQHISMHLEFLLLSRRIQVWIARVNLSCLLKNLSFTWMVRMIIASEIESIFKDLDQQNIQVSFD